MKGSLEQHTVRFQHNGKQESFVIEHNLPNIRGLRLEDAVVNWLARTKVYTAISLCNYVKSKDLNLICNPINK